MREPDRWTVATAGGAVTALTYRSETAGDRALVLAHGAGAGQESAFLVGFAQALARLGLETVTFNFPYTEQRRRVPDRREVLEACYRAVIERTCDRMPGARAHLFIGGKSMGGRIATQVAAADPGLPVTGLVLLGYPLHPPGKPEQRRDAHLKDVRRPMLIVQGSRDAFGTAEELDRVLKPLSPAALLHVVAGGDHSFKVPKSSGVSQTAVYEDVQRTIVEWVGTVTKGVRGTRPRPG
jgi:predicted alpha/beta-hydrolase family hydrolase